MDTATLLQTQFGTLERQFKLALKDLSLEQRHWQPVPQANSIGFLHPFPVHYQRPVGSFGEPGAKDHTQVSVKVQLDWPDSCQAAKAK
jgi:hypothetical protein